MTTTERRTPELASVPTFSRLLRVEALRLRTRRFSWVMLALVVVGFLFSAVMIWANHSAITPENRAEAERARAVDVATSAGYVQQCLNGEIPPEYTPVEFCGAPPVAEDLPLEWFYDVDPFVADDVTSIAVTLGVGVAMVGFLWGATTIGAEWSSKNLVAWLFWEPRRVRLLTAKALVLVTAVAILALLMQAIWLGTAQLLLQHRGIPLSEMSTTPPDFWSHALGVSFRTAVLAVPVALLGFGLANLLRNTAAAIGVVLVYLLGESILGALDPSLARFQFSVSAIAWVQRDGYVIYDDPVFDPATQQYISSPIEISNLQGLGVIVLYAVVIGAISAWQFRSRDIT